MKGIGLTVNFVFVYSHIDSLGAKLIDTFTFSHEHYLQLVSLWIVVNILGKFLVNEVFLDRNIDSNSLLKLNNVLLESFNLSLSILQLF